jgi:hypothetical protein
MDIDKFRRTIAVAEGDRRYPYDDATGQRIKAGVTVKGHPSIALGHNLDVPMSDVVADAIFDDDLGKLLPMIQKALPWFDSVGDVRQRAIAEIGWSGIGCLLTFRKESLPLMQAGRWAEAAANIRSSDWAKTVGAVRSGRVAKMLETGKDEE